VPDAYTRRGVSGDEQRGRDCHRIHGEEHIAHRDRSDVDPSAVRTASLTTYAARTLCRFSC
jgi:hypothetical protein